ncbi:MAG: hypothetical protein JO311_05730, partial [Candidatus Eremiobacteraeota bacterium]|nr:hypothetical protein [Candidatus Eremiobacteraeota bacterium]
MLRALAAGLSPREEVAGSRAAGANAQPMVKRALLMLLSTAVLAAVTVAAGSSGRSAAAVPEHWTAVSQT